EQRSSLYVLHTEHSPVSTSAQVAASPKVPAPPPIVESSLVVASPPVVASGQVSASCSCLPIVFPLLPPSPAPPCTPCVAGRLRATPHSSSLCLATAPFQTLYLDV
ncbi:unnamed protein product, partial [Closterium sp. NIES-54]